MTDQKSVSKCRRLLSQAVPDLVSVGCLLRAAREMGGFAEFCHSVGLHSRKAYDLIAIADAVASGLLAHDVVREIGWSKARLIATQATTKREAQRALIFARNHTLPALAAFLRTDGVLGPLVTKCFHVTPGDSKIIEAALRSAGARLRAGRLDNRSEALMRIVRAHRVRSATRGRDKQR
jgi:hypothetical protein